MSVPRWFRRELDIGDEGSDVEVVRLKLGLGPGVYDTNTKRMVLALARKKGIPSDGEVNSEVAEQLGSTAAEDAGLTPSWYVQPVDQMFQEGEDIRALRERLGLGSTDNRFDPDAESAVRRFQSAHGLPMTGQVNEDLAKLIG